MFHRHVCGRGQASGDDLVDSPNRRLLSSRSDAARTVCGMRTRRHVPRRSRMLPVHRCRLLSYPCIDRAWRLLESVRRSEEADRRKLPGLRLLSLIR